MMAPETRQERRKREKKQREQKKVLDDAIANAPQHVRSRLGQPSKLGNSLETPKRETDRKGDRQWNASGAKFDDYGQTTMRENPEGQGANLERCENREDYARDLRERYPNIWGKRGAAKKIEAAEHRRRAERPKDEDERYYPEPPTIGTIRRYIKDFP